MPLSVDALKTQTIAALHELKATDVQVLDVRDLASFTDFMMIASGNSSRQLKALADKVIAAGKKAGASPLGVEGLRDAEWILIDFGDIVLHIMLPATRDFYNLEKLWSLPVATVAAQ